MTGSLITTWVPDPWESQALSLRVGRVRVGEPTAGIPVMTDAWRHGVDVVYVDAPGPLTGSMGPDVCFVGILRELALDLDLDLDLDDTGTTTAAGALPPAQRRPPDDVARFDLGGRYERDPLLAPLADRVYQRWLADAACDPDREVWALDGDAGLLVLAPDAPTSRIELIGVARGHRGQGLGSALLRLAQARARAGGAGRLVVGGYAHNKAAMRLYASCGLRECARRWRYHLHRPGQEAPR